MKAPDPTSEHLWLQQLVGRWEYEFQYQMDPGSPPQTSHGSQQTRQLGQLWIITQIFGVSPGGEATESVMTLGFDPGVGKFVGSFISSMMNNMWPYRGELNAKRTILTLDSVGPNFADPNSSDSGTAQYQDIIEVLDADRHTMRSQIQNADGSWTEFMLGKYKRVG